MPFSVFYASLVISSTKGGDGERQMRKENAKERTEEKETGGSSGTGLALRENSRIMLQHVWPSRAGKCHSLQCHTSSHPRIPFCTPQLYISSMRSVVFISWQAHWACVTRLDSFDLSSTFNVHCKTWVFSKTSTPVNSYRQFIPPYCCIPSEMKHPSKSNSLLHSLPALTLIHLSKLQFIYHSKCF